MLDTVLDVVALAFMSWGVVQSLIAGIGLVRFPDVLTRMHAASKPQMLGVVMVFAGAALYSRSWAVAGFLLVAVLAEFLTVPASSSLVGRSAFRRGFVAPENLVHDELSAHLPRGLADTDDTEGFLGDGVAGGEGAWGTQDADQKMTVPEERSARTEDNTFALDKDEFVNFEIDDESGEPAHAEYPAGPRRTEDGDAVPDSEQTDVGPGSADRLG